MLSLAVHSTAFAAKLKKKAELRRAGKEEEEIKAQLRADELSHEEKGKKTFKVRCELTMNRAESRKEKAKECDTEKGKLIQWFDDWNGEKATSICALSFLIGCCVVSYIFAEKYTKLDPSPKELNEFFSKTEACGVSQVIAIAPSSLGETLTGITKAMVVITLMFLSTILKARLARGSGAARPAPPAPNPDPERHPQRCPNPSLRPGARHGRKRLPRLPQGEVCGVALQMYLAARQGGEREGQQAG